MVLQGLAEVAPPGRWLVWGPDEMGRLCWPGAVHVPTAVDPVAWFGQRSVLRVPKADRALHLHQTRPAHLIPAATCVLDLIQLQEPRAMLRLAKSVRLRASVRAARALFTINSSVRDALVAQYGADPASITVLRLPVDRAAAARVAARRAAAGTPDRYLIAIGRFDRHKNLARLVDAYAQTRFAAGGGGLTLVGGTVDELRALGVTVVPAGLKVLGRLDPAGVEAALAGATALVQASLSEGYGLPVAEALLAEVPVVTSPVPAVTEFGPAGVPTFDPSSVPELRDAVDEAVALVDAGAYWGKVDRASWAAGLPTVRDLATQVVAGLDRMGQ
jgi:glycosyltransferase involved in cell wall biosynthesis